MEMGALREIAEYLYLEEKEAEHLSSVYFTMFHYTRTIVSYIITFYISIKRFISLLYLNV